MRLTALAALAIACAAAFVFRQGAPASGTGVSPVQDDERALAELAVLTAENFEQWAPAGKEVDAIFGDIVLRNRHLVAVIANPVPGRNANMTVRDVGGAVIDLTRRDRQSDQLSCFYPCARRFPLAMDDAYAEELNPDGVWSGEEAFVELLSAAAEGRPEVRVVYRLAADAPYLTIQTRFINRSDAPLEVPLEDDCRADRDFEKTPNGPTNLFWVYDRWFEQAYGLAAEDGVTLDTASDARNSTIRYVDRGQSRITLQPGDNYTLTRRLFPGDHLLDVLGTYHAMDDGEVGTVPVELTYGDGTSVAQADITIARDGQPYGSGRTDDEGRAEFSLPSGAYEITVRTPDGQESRMASVSISGANRPTVPIRVRFDEPGYLVGRIGDEAGDAIPCKVQLVGIDGTENPVFGPDTGEWGVQNLIYSEDGRFRRIVPPGRYRAIVSRGPEYDAVFTELEIARGEETTLEATLIRSVDTTGWISSDFHSHSSPSGDNTSSQLGRVLNLVCEHLEFAPCTEHNRLSTYDPHIAELGIERFLSTCVGIELTGSPLLVNHQNAFPLELRPGLQDGGAPLTDASPEVQIERLAFWDDRSDKLVQVNHPDIGWMFYDRDGDGSPDQGFAGMVPHMDVIEIHIPSEILSMQPIVEYGGQRQNHRTFNWLQILNQGHRIPGVMNTDAHYNFHGSGWIRNWIASPTDDPAEIDVMDVVHAAQRGNLVMSTGPFLEVTLMRGTAGSSSGPVGPPPAPPLQRGERDAETRGRGAHAIPGDDVECRDGRAELHVRVQCPNWFDIDRVQVLRSGRPDPALNFTRAASPEMFSDEVVTFDETLAVEMNEDTHLIVVAIDEDSTLGEVMGPEWGALLPPIAISNPIWVDVDGGGFQPNGDTLDAPLPVRVP